MQIIRSKSIVWLIGALIVLLSTSLCWASNIYVDPSLSSDITNGSYSVSARNSSGNDGDAYRTIQAALNNMVGGDDIFIRGGLYREGPITIPMGKDGTSSNWSSIQSYSGEWAIIDGQRSSSKEYALGYTCYDKNGASQHHYWKFERLEITGGSVAGLFISGGPFIVRYCYIHDNVASNGGPNPGGIKGMIWHDSLVEFCWFKDNGATTVSENCQHIGIHSDYAHATGWDWGELGVKDPNNATRRNEYRYNLFQDPAGRGSRAIKHKSHQAFNPQFPENMTMTYKDYGDKVHHNIIQDGLMLQMDQDFVQVYNNILHGGELAIGHPRMYTLTYAVTYNNLVIGNQMSHHYGDAQARSTPSDPPIRWYAYNNIVDQAGHTWNQYQINVAPDGADNAYLDMGPVKIDRNYIYRPTTGASGELYKLGHGPASIKISNTSFNNSYSTANYTSSSMEQSNSLYQGTSGWQMYTTRGNHALPGGGTIGNGGVNIPHPYLANVQIPGYIGATNPDSDEWPSGVLSLASVDTLRNATGAEPGWVEGGSGSQSIAISPPGGLRFIKITAPTAETNFSTSQSTIVLHGIYAGTNQLSNVAWSNAGSGANGNVNIDSGVQWSSDTIQLVSGMNTITITGTDSMGRTCMDNIEITMTN